MLDTGIGTNQSRQATSLVRVVTCGSVDSGKSTLIGRLLYDLDALTEDELREIDVGAGNLDFSRNLDGLMAEREQGITIDVAYRSFFLQSRRFLLADVPGHEQYTRNMVTGASAADVCLMVVDIRSKVGEQTRRHAYLAWLLGIRQFVLAVNKMDLVGFEQSVFENLAAEYKEFFAGLGQPTCKVVPVSARLGENIVYPSAAMKWFSGATVSQALHDSRVEEAEIRPFRFPVQWVNRSVDERRAYSGMVASGTARVADELIIQPPGQAATIAAIITPEGPCDDAAAGQSISIVFDREIDVGRGHLICAAADPAAVADLLEARVIWMSESPLVRGRSYRLKIGTRVVSAQISRVKEKLDLANLAFVQTETLSMNEIGSCTLTLDQPVAFDPYTESRETGGFILIDRISNDTIAAGLITAGELHFRNIPWQVIDVSKAARSALKNQTPAVLWFTGIPGAGKSTVANQVERLLHARGRHTYLLDGDNIRHGLTRDLGFTDVDRVENVRRVAEVARLMADAGLIVLVALISPFRADRRAARETVDEDFIEIFVDTPVEVAEARDVKGHYRRARLGELGGFTALTGKYEPPEHPELHIHTVNVAAEELAEKVLAYLDNRERRRERRPVREI